MSPLSSVPLLTSRCSCLQETAGARAEAGPRGPDGISWQVSEESCQAAVCSRESRSQPGEQTSSVGRLLLCSRSREIASIWPQGQLAAKSLQMKTKQTLVFATPQVCVRVAQVYVAKPALVHAALYAPVGSVCFLSLNNNIIL